MSLAKKVVEGDVRSAARLMRDIEDEIPSAREELREIYPYTGNAHIIGLTGSSGTGKSTLVDKLLKAYREQRKTVGVIAVDPTSPFTGGAILGDRIRMQKHSTDEGVFIRSVATRGHLGGISRSTNNIIDVLDALGKEVVIVETVGVGQDEVEIVRTAHTTIVVLVPGMGDDIQAIKAGILEVGDIFVVNKADRGGADKTVREIEYMLFNNAKSEGSWSPVVLKAQAIHDIGIPELIEKIENHRSFLLEEGQMDNVIEDRIRQKFVDELKNMLLKKGLERIEGREFDEIIRSLVEKRDDAYSQAEKVVKQILR
ncbi:MAG: methylmalonyl Co-A mutase-associated GTPase MeaB [Desulfobacteraceae bacterium]|jgi:LAO/AO transport system kinase